MKHVFTATFLIVAICMAVACGKAIVESKASSDVSKYEWTNIDNIKWGIRYENKEIVCYVFNQSSNCKWKDK